MFSGALNTYYVHNLFAEIHKKCGNMLAHEDDVVEFTYPDQNLMKNLSSFSFIGGSGYAPYSVAQGDGLKKAILGKDANFSVHLKDQLREQRTVITLHLN